MAASGRATRLLLLAGFATFFDRALLPPLLPVIARDLGASVESVGDALTAYVVAYAGAQLLWSVVATRVGRLRGLALACVLAVAGNLVSALAVDPTMLLVGRTIAGAALGATVPAVLVYFGDTLTLRARAVAAANLAAALSLGMTVGTLAASFAGAWVGWRTAFVAIAVLSALIAVLLMLLPEPPPTPPQRFLPALGRILRGPWAVLVLVLTLLEGIVLVGVLNYLPVSLQVQGESVVAAGLVTAAFGVAVIAFSMLVKRLVDAWPSWLMLLVGGLGAVAGYALLVWSVTVVTMAAAVVLLGFAWAFAHTQMQTWMTDAAVTARPVGISLFSVALFTGGSIGTAMGNAAVPSGSFSVLFAVATVVALVFAVAASLARASYRVQER